MQNFMPLMLIANEQNKSLRKYILQYLWKFYQQKRIIIPMPSLWFWHLLNVLKRLNHTKIQTLACLKHKLVSRLLKWTRNSKSVC